VTVTGYVPETTVPSSINVIVLVDVAGFVSNAATEPAGTPLATSDTLPSKPFTGAIVIVTDAWNMRNTSSLLADADSVKFGGGVTVKLIVAVCTKLPDVPVMVTVAGPVVALPLAVNVTTLVMVAGFVPITAVTPVGKPVAASVTLPLKPPVPTIRIVLIPLGPPWVMLTLDGSAERLKFGGALTVSDTMVVCVKLPETPVIVTEAAPIVAVPLAVNVRTLVVVAGFVANTAVTPVGKADAVSVTLPEKASVGVIVIVLVPPAPPCVIVTLLGAADRLKFGVVDAGHAFARFVTFTVPMPVAKSQPVVVPYAFA
jgi:hypothetical protein